MDSGKWSPPRTVYEHYTPVRGLTVWAHKYSLIFNDDPATRWVISEASSGLRINNEGCKTRALALAEAELKMGPYTDEYLAITVANEVAKQVAHQLTRKG